MEQMTKVNSENIVGINLESDSDLEKKVKWKKFPRYKSNGDGISNPMENRRLSSLHHPGHPTM